MSPEKPMTVRHLEGVVAGVLLQCMRRALISNAKEQPGNQCRPSMIREFWRERVWTHWSEFRQAWVIIDNIEAGVRSLVFYPQRGLWGQWTVQPVAPFAIDWPMAHGEVDLTHEEAEQLALSLYKHDDLNRISAADYQ